MNRFALRQHRVFSPSLFITIMTIGFFAPLNVWAQESTDGMVSDTVSSLSITPSNVAINVESCEDVVQNEEFTLSGTYNNPSLTVNYHVRLIATTGSSCSHEDVCNEVALDDGGCSCLKQVSNTGTVSTTFTVADLFDEPCIAGEEKNISFFLHYTETEADPLIGLNPIEEESQALKLSVDLNPPSAPDEAPSVTPAEEALVINAPEVGGDVVKYEACVWAEDLSREDARCKEVTGGSGDRFEGLVNDQLYNVIYVVYDDAENKSEDSPMTTGTPASVLDFAEVYSGEYPGGERGGCDQRDSSKGLISLFFFLLTLIFTKRAISHQKSSKKAPKEALVNILGLTLTALLISPLSAEARPTGSQSQRSSTVQFSGGTYQPKIDEEFQAQDGVQRPYERVFEDQSPVMFQIQMERHLIQNKGTVSLGGSVGYWSVEGKGLSVTNIAETTKLSIIPFSVYAAYRFDMFQKVFPLVPVVKAGLSYYSWTIYDGAGDVAQFMDNGQPSSEASGGTMGYFYTIGAHFLLDFLDREMAWAFDRDAGVNHSYLTFEYQSSQVDDFADPDSFRLGNNVYFFGIALDL